MASCQLVRVVHYRVTAPIWFNLVLIVNVRSRWWLADGKAVVEPDASSASYPFAVAAATGSTITVPHLNERSLQGDYGFVDVLAQMGCTVVKHNEWTKVTGQSTISAFCFAPVATEYMTTLVFCETAA